MSREYDQIRGLIRSTEECLYTAYKRGYKDGKNSVDMADFIEIPEGATNGNMIKVMFPNCEICERRVRTMSQGEIVVGYDVFLYTSHSTKSGMRFGIKIFFDVMWWNSPYRKERE